MEHDNQTASESMDFARAVELQKLAQSQGDLLTWCIYRSPSDMPGKMVARPHSARHNAPLLHHIEADGVVALRRLLPPGLHCISRAPSDDPVIVETWV